MSAMKNIYNHNHLEVNYITKGARIYPETNCTQLNFIEDHFSIMRSESDARNADEQKFWDDDCILSISCTSRLINKVQSNLK